MQYPYALSVKVLQPLVSMRPVRPFYLWNNFPGIWQGWVSHLENKLSENLVKLNTIFTPIWWSVFIGYSRICFCDRIIYTLLAEMYVATIQCLLMHPSQQNDHLLPCQSAFVLKKPLSLCWVCVTLKTIAIVLLDLKIGFLKVMMSQDISSIPDIRVFPAFEFFSLHHCLVMSCFVHLQD